MRRFVLALRSSITALAAAVRPAAGRWPGRFGPFYRTGSTQDDNTTRQQQGSGEIWRKPDRGSNFPSVDAWFGPLPDDKPGIEFYTDVQPSQAVLPIRRDGEARVAASGSKAIGPRSGLTSPR
jgi:hypothetical protein